MKRIKWLTMCLMLVLCGLGVSADTLINLDMQKTSGNAVQSGPAVLGSTGDIWNTYIETTPRTTLIADLKDSAGTTTAVDFNFTPGGDGGTGFNKNDAAAAPIALAIRSLMRDYWYRSASPDTWGPVSFSGLVAGQSYKLVCFSAEIGKPTNSAKFAVDGVTKILSGGVSTEIPSLLVEGAHYVVFEGIVPASGQIDIEVKKGSSGTVVVNGFQLLLGSKRGAAHTPVPVDSATAIDPATLTSVSWYSPLQDASGNPKADPNIVSVTGYDVWFGTVEPNDVTGNTKVSTNQPGQSYSPATLAYSTTYYWRVDARLTWNGAGFPAIVKGSVWKLTTKPFYTPPVLTFNGVVTLQSLLPAPLSASVTGNTLPITNATFTLLTNDVEFPAGAVASVTPTTTNNLTPTATLTTDIPGKYKVKLVISDGTTVVEKMVEVLVYASTDDCAARKAPGTWVANYYDRNSSCVVNLGDFAPLAAAWLNDTGLLAQQTYTGAVNTYVPKAIFDARIEAESVSQTDPNAVSNYPVTDTVGIRISTKTQAIGGGKILGYTVNGTPPVGEYAQYIINIPAAGTYDLHLYAAIPTVTGGLDFGIAGNPTLYGSVAMLPGTGYTDYFYRVYPGALTFTSAGPTVVRITWNTQGSDLDWFTLVKQ